MMSAQLPVHVETDRTLRVKIIDSCGLACTFCHDEGTPVLADNKTVEPSGFVSAGTVGDFEVTNELLGKLGYIPKSYQETKRVSFLLDGGRLEIDHWPMIPPYLEIEADSHEHVLRIAEKLGFGEGQLTGENTIKIYARHGYDLNVIPELRFSQS